MATITTISGRPASVLGLAAHPVQDPRCVGRAAEGGINYSFFYGAGQSEFINALRPLVQSCRDEILITSGSGARTASGLRAARRKILAAAGCDVLDIFFAEYINPDDGHAAIFGAGGVLDELQKWKSAGAIRYVGATAHDRRLARELAEDPRVDVLMHRFNMAHRKAETEVFPTALSARTPVVAFTATRWGTLLSAPAGWKADAATAADCYQFCLAQPAVRLVLTAPRTVAELEQNLAVIEAHRMSKQTRHNWEAYGDLVYDHGCGGKHDFESQWP